MDAAEGEGTSEEEAQFTEIEAAANSVIDGSVIFHLVVDVLGFVLFMHHQIPSILQDMSLAFDGLQTECKELEIILAHTDRKTMPLRRLHIGRMREVKQGIKKMQKLMKIVTNLRTALQLLLSENPEVREVMIILGANVARPQHVYELCFSHGKVVSRDAGDLTRTKAAEGLSRKAVRALISAGAGSNAYAGPAKLFVLVKAPSSLNMPLHFLPKRDFKYRKKTIPFRLQFKCKTKDHELGGHNYVAQTADSTSLNCCSDDLIWFQCRHIIKGMPSKTSPAEH